MGSSSPKSMVKKGSCVHPEVCCNAVQHDIGKFKENRASIFPNNNTLLRKVQKL